MKDRGIIIVRAGRPVPFDDDASVLAAVAQHHLTAKKSPHLDIVHGATQPETGIVADLARHLLDKSARRVQMLARDVQNTKHK